MATTWHDDPEAIDPEFEDVPGKAPAGAEPIERLAVVSLVAGIVGFFLPVVGPVTAIVSGHVARDEIRKSRGRLGGDAMARTGLILGYVWVGLMVGLLAVAFSVLSYRDVERREPVDATLSIGHDYARDASGLVPATFPQIRTIEVPSIESIPLPSGYGTTNTRAIVRIDGSGTTASALSPAARAPAPPEPPPVP